MTNTTMNEYVDNILAENLTLTCKLQSKCEAVSILNGEVDKLRCELNGAKSAISTLKSQQIVVNNEPGTVHVDSLRILQLEINSLRQKLRDAYGDVQALRNQLNCDKPTLNISKPYSENERNAEELVQQLERLQSSKMQLEGDYHALLDEKEELASERDAYKCKLHRLNHECNILLKGSSNNLIDLDALILENRDLQERLLQAQEECQLSKQISERYKSLLHPKKAKDGRSADDSISNGGGLHISQKQVKEVLDSYKGKMVEPDVGQIHSLCVALLDGLSDKSLALSHQKRANRILAARISQLESQIHATRTSNLSESPSKLLLEGYQSPPVGQLKEISCPVEE